MSPGNIRQDNEFKQTAMSVINKRNYIEMKGIDIENNLRMCLCDTCMYARVKLRDDYKNERSPMSDILSTCDYI